MTVHPKAPAKFQAMVTWNQYDSIDISAVPGRVKLYKEYQAWKAANVSVPVKIVGKPKLVIVGKPRI